MLEKQERHLAVSLDPLDDHLVVEPVDAETWTRSGLVLPVGADTGCRSGIVTAVGADVTGVEVGDKVLFPKDAGWEVRLPSGMVRVLKRESLIARVLD